MVDVLFTSSYFLAFDAKEYRTMMPYPPLGTLYAASFLRSKGLSVALFDAMIASSEKELLANIRASQPKIVVIYDDDFNYLTKMCLSRMRQAAFALSAIAKGQGCHVIVHSSDAADHLESYLNHGADYIVIGEGEVTLHDVVKDILNRAKSRLSTIDGIAYKTNDDIQRNRKRNPLQDLDVLPFPAWDLVDIERYRTIWKKRHGYFSMNMVTTRGCPFHCNWCAKPIYGQVYNTRSPANVVDEMLWLKNTYRPDHIWFCDDIFGLKPGWICEFSQKVISDDARIPFKCLARADLLLKDRTIEDLSTSGCQTVWIGAESGSQKILDAMEKGTTVEQISIATKRMHDAGIRVGFFLQYGYPGETREDINRTLTMVKECKPDEIGISVSYPLPGTKFYNTVKNQLGEKQNWVDSEDLDLMFAGEYAPDFYRALHTVTHKKFRIWQGVELFKKSLRHPTTIGTRQLRAMAATAYHALTINRYSSLMEFHAARSHQHSIHESHQ